jgi:hypothetical protein
MQVSSHPSAVSGTPMTMRWQKRSMVCTRLKSSIEKGHGSRWAPLNMRPSPGLTGSITADSLGRSEIFLRQKPKPTTMQPEGNRYRCMTLTELPPGLPGRFRSPVFKSLIFGDDYPTTRVAGIIQSACGTILPESTTVLSHKSLVRL